MDFQVGQVDGVLTEHYPDGSVHTEAHFSDGWRHGLYRVWHVEGQLLVRTEYERGRPIGRSEGWFPDGSREFVDELDDRGALISWANWRENGVLRSRGVPTDEVGMLALTFYYEDGSVQCAGRRPIGGRNEGEWSWWTPVGKLDEAKSGVFVGGRRVRGLASPPPRPTPVLGPMGPFPLEGDSEDP